jgi:hypothetical protein
LDLTSPRRLLRPAYNFGIFRAGLRHDDFLWGQSGRGHV